MAITYTWSFDPLETKPTEGDLADVVTTVHWRLSGVDDGEAAASASVYGAIGAGAADADNFTAFADLAEATVKGWVLAAQASEEETAEQVETRLQENIANQIANILNPPIVNKSAPWVS